MLRSQLPPDAPELIVPEVAPVAGPYDPAAAKNFVYRAAASYCDKASIQSWNCLACQSLPGIAPVAYLYDATLDVAGYVANDNGVAIVSFRGTVSLEDWLVDFDFAQVTPLGNCPNCLVHQGFYNSYESLRTQMVAALNQISAKEVMITGHSLGAAIAAIAAYDLSSVFSVGTYYTFGQPRVGNDAFYTYFKSILNEYRVVHYADIVPHLPLEAMGFHHVSTEVWYNEDSSSFKVCDGSGEDPTCSDSLPLPISISDHLEYLGLPISKLCT